MKQGIIALAIGGIAATSSPVHAQEGGTMPDWANKNGGFGIGGNTTLGGVNGINIRTYVTPLFGLHATIGLETDSVSVDAAGTTVDNSVFSFRAGLYGSYKLAYWQRGHLSTIFGLDLVTLSQSTDQPGQPTVDQSGTDILIGLGLMGEWFPTQYLSLFLQVGLTLDFIGEDEVSGDGGNYQINPNPGVSGIDLNLEAQPLGAAGFTVWFK